MGCNYEILSHLPPTGPMHEQFSATGSGYHREGVVIKFMPDGGESWIGNFQPGDGGIIEVLPYANDLYLMVIALGQGYIINPIDRKLIGLCGNYIQEIYEIPGQDAIILDESTFLVRYEKDGKIAWRTERISWDGLRNVRIEGDRIKGEAYTPMSDTNNWLPFQVDLETGELTGGSYNGPDISGNRKHSP